MALDTRIALAIKPPEIDDPAVAYSRALTNRRGEQILSEGALDLQAKQAKAQQDRDQRMKDAQVSQILARSASPYDAIESIYQVDPNKAHDLASKNADQAMRMIQGVSSYQALQSVWPTVQKYVGPQDLPQFQSQDEFNQWKREQALAHVDAKTYLEQTKPAAQRTTENPTEASLALAAAGGDEPSTKALEIIKGQRAKEPTDTSDLSKSSLDVQAAAALAKGDMDTYNRLLKVKKEMGQADNRVPAGGAGLGASIAIKPNTKEYRLAQDLAYGKISMADFRAMYGRAASNADLKVALYDQARQLNPAFNPAAFEAGYKLASSPKVQQQLASLDNVIQAVPDLLKVSDDATRSKYPILNGLAIKGGIALGNQKYSNFDTAVTAFADELSGALGYGSATDMSREMGFNMTQKNLGPDQFRSALQNIVVPFVNRKRSTLLNQMGPYGQPGMNPAADAAAAAGGDSALSVKAPNGRTYTFRTKADADAFRTRAGIQ